jgi:hypothetical protein
VCSDYKLHPLQCLTLDKKHPLQCLTLDKKQPHTYAQPFIMSPTRIWSRGLQVLQILSIVTSNHRLLLWDIFRHIHVLTA